jgi:cell division protein FtsB
MEIAKKEVEHIKSLEEALEKSSNQEQMYAEAVENLQAEYDILEAENNALKKEANKREEKRQSVLRKANFDLSIEGDDGSSSSSSAAVQEMAGNYYEMTSQVETLKASIRYLRAENAQLKSSDFVRSLDLDINTTKPRKEEDNKREEIKSVARETRVLVKDMRIASASPRVIQLSSLTKPNLWQTIKKSPDYQYQIQQSVLYTLKQRSEQLRRKVDDLAIIPPLLMNEKVSLEVSLFVT